VNAVRVNLRSGPGLGTLIIGMIEDKDTPLTVVDRQNDWYRVETEAGPAWIYHVYVTLGQPLPEQREGLGTDTPASRKRILVASSDGAEPLPADNGTDAGVTEVQGEAEEVAEMVLESTTGQRASEPGRAYYDFGVFAYEDGDYEDAVSNFETALSADDQNPFYHHFLGKTYQQMKMYVDSAIHLYQAWRLDPDMSGLRYDLAHQNYKAGDFERASGFFVESVKEDPSNVLAYYYAGISNFKLERYESALPFFFDAIEKSPSIKANGFYYAGICYRKMREIDKAMSHFEYVRDHADSQGLIDSAEKWLEEIAAYRRANRPLGLYAKLGSSYDTNVRLEPLDADVYADEDDFLSQGFVSGRYNFVNTEDLKIGLGYSHYQTVYGRLETYNLIGSIGSFNIRYSMPRLTLGLNYFPSIYWLDGHTYMRRQELRPEVMIKLSNSLSMRFSYSYYNVNHVQDDGRDGNIDGFSLDGYNSFPRLKMLLYGGVGYEVYYPSDPDQDYGQAKARLGVSLTLPLDLKLDAMGRYYHKRYENPDSLFGMTRKDDKYTGSLAISRNLIYHWLTIIAEYSYTRNDSNITVYDYQRQTATLSLATKY